MTARLFPKMCIKGALKMSTNMYCWSVNIDIQMQPPGQSVRSGTDHPKCVIALLKYQTRVFFY